MKKSAFILSFILSFLLLIYAFIFSASAQSAVVLQYDDYRQFGENLSIVSQNAEKGESVIEISGDTVHATGIGTAVIDVDGERVNVKVTKSDIHIMVTMGQSNAGTNCGNVDDATECLPGTAYFWNEVNKTEPLPLTKLNQTRSALAAEWYAQSCANGKPEKVALIQITKITNFDGVSITTDSPYDPAFGWISQTADGYKLLTPGLKTCETYNNCYDYFNNSPFYNVTGSGVYWFQGEHDADVDSTAPDGRKYIDYFKNLWSLLQKNTNSKLSYFAFFRVKGSDYPANYTLSFCSPVVAQYKSANDVEDIYTASNITEEWYAEKGSITIDVSDYLTIPGDSVTYLYPDLYGYNKAHYYQCSYNILGADAARNMYRCMNNLNDDSPEVVLLERTGKAETRKVCDIGKSVKINLSGMNDFIINLGTECNKNTVMTSKVICNGNDITAEVADYNGVFDTEKLISYAKLDDVKIVCTVKCGGKTLGEAVYELTADGYNSFCHWDFTDSSLYRKNEYGGVTVLSSADGQALHLMNMTSAGIKHDENGISVKQSTSKQEFTLSDSVKTNLENGYAVEFTLKLNNTESGAVILGNFDSVKPKTKVWFYFTSGEVNKLILGESGSLSFTSDESKFDFTDFATYTYVYNPNGTISLTITQGDITETYEGVINRGEIPQPDIKYFLPYINNSRYLFDGVVKDLKIWTSFNDYTCAKAGGHTSSDMLVHRQVSCTENGMNYKCCTVCGLILERKVIKSTGHNPAVYSEMMPATCVTKGHTAETRCLNCGAVIIASKEIPATGHKDEDGDKLCDICGEDLEIQPQPVKCNCNCHKSGFMGFIWKIQRFFYKLFGLNKECACGAVHY